MSCPHTEPEGICPDHTAHFSIQPYGAEESNDRYLIGHTASVFISNIPVRAWDPDDEQGTCCEWYGGCNLEFVETVGDRELRLRDGVGHLFVVPANCVLALSGDSDAEAEDAKTIDQECCFSQEICPDHAVHNPHDYPQAWSAERMRVTKPDLVWVSRVYDDMERHYQYCCEWYGTCCLKVVELGDAMVKARDGKGQLFEVPYNCIVEGFKGEWEQP